MAEKYLITAAYAAHLGDGPQVYETDVWADSVEEAEQAAQEQCISDNNWEEDDWECYDGANGTSETAGPLVDIFARPAQTLAMTEWRGYPVTEQQHTTLTVLTELLQGSFAGPAEDGPDFIIGKGNRTVRVERDGSIHANTQEG